MVSLIYIVWGVVPFTLLMMTLYSVAKPALKISGKENTRNYAMQFFFTALALGLTIYIDTSEWYGYYMQYISTHYIDITPARFLLYPLVLLLMVMFDGMKRKSQDDTVKSKRVIQKF